MPRRIMQIASKKQAKIICCVFFAMLLASSCGSNRISFDMENQAIVGEYGRISSFIIDCMYGECEKYMCWDDECEIHGLLFFELKPEAEMTRFVSIKELTKNYYIEKHNIKDFKLLPNSVYEIQKRNGFLIRTDEHGSVIYVNHNYRDRELSELSDLEEKSIQLRKERAERKEQKKRERRKEIEEKEKMEYRKEIEKRKRASDVLPDEPPD